MKHLIIPLLLVGDFVALTTTEASAVVCAAGVYRVGCVAAAHVLSLSLHVLLLSLRALSLSLLSVAGFTDNSDNNGSEYSGLRVEDDATGRSSGPERRLVISVRRKRPPRGRDCRLRQDTSIRIGAGECSRSFICCICLHFRRCAVRSAASRGPARASSEHRRKRRSEVEHRTARHACCACHRPPDSVGPKLVLNPK
jgi:hypothetical protein